MKHGFEEAIRKLTEPVNGQFPRPWMTEMKNPWEADVFIVGMNQRNGYDVDRVSHRRHLDALFNRNGESCRGLYDELTEGKPSPTRKNTESLVAHLKRRSIHGILETNVICYSTPMSSDLRRPEHSGGTESGEDIFRYLLAEVAPAILIAHGAGTSRRLSRILQSGQLRVPRSEDEICDVQLDGQLVIPIPSLALLHSADGLHGLIGTWIESHTGYARN